jgi:PurA ssDNA and RNA-binding protein
VDTRSNYQDEGDGYRGQRRHQPALHTEKIITDRKVFFLDLKENDRGRVLKITEDVRGRRDTIMVPMEALRDFIESLQRIEDAANGDGYTPPERRDD